MDEYSVYILQSDKHGRYYTGMTRNIANRMSRHNAGLNISTASGVPWRLIRESGAMPKSDALKLERKIKKRGAKRFLQDLEL